MASKNIYKIYEKIIVDLETFQKIKEYCNFSGLEEPREISLNSQLFNLYLEKAEKIETDLTPNWVTGSVNMQQNRFKQAFYNMIKNIFETSNTNPPILTKFIFYYHIYDDPADRQKALEIFNELLKQINIAYDSEYLRTPENERYFDGGYNLNEDKLSVKAVKRIDEIFEIDTNYNLQNSDMKVKQILTEYGLL